jgi:hypothetical protein
LGVRFEMCVPLRMSCAGERVFFQNIVGESLIFLERETGVEPATSSLGSWHSTTELLPLTFASNDIRGTVSILNTE